MHSQGTFILLEFFIDILYHNRILVQIQYGCTVACFWVSIYTFILCFFNFHQNSHFSFGSFPFNFISFCWVWFQKLKIMVDPQTPIPPHLYPQAIQLKLYQAFIFSIPILFSIILFLLFYLFYLKRRASALSSSPPMILPVSSTHQPSSHLTSVSLTMSL